MKKRFVKNYGYHGERGHLVMIRRARLLDQEMIATAYSLGGINIECDETSQDPVIIINHDDAFNWIDFSKSDLIEELKRLSVTHITVKDGVIGASRGLKFIVKERTGFSDHESIIVDMPCDDTDDVIKKREEAYIDFNNSITRR